MRRIRFAFGEVDAGTNTACYSSQLSILVAAMTADDVVYDRYSHPYAPSGEAVLESNRGFFDLTWTIVKADGTTPAPCPPAGTSAIEAFGQRFECAVKHAVASALPAGTYEFEVKLQRLYNPEIVVGTLGVGRVDTMTIEADTITQVAVTIVLSE